MIKNDDKKISVILPVKNGDLSLLKRAISSVRTQTFPGFEILLIDDGSEKPFAEELKTIAETDDRIRLYHIAPSGVSGARNFGIEKAEGDVITLLDSDDVISPVCFEEALLLLENSDAEALWGGTWYFESSDLPELGKWMRRKTALGIEELKAREVKLSSDRVHKTRAECIGEPFRFGENGYINRGIAARFIRKEVFEGGRNRFFLGIKMYEDAIWNLLMLENHKISYVQSIWYYYYNNEASVSNRFNPDVLECMEVPLKMIREILDLEDPEEYTAYTRILMDSLRYVYKCLFGHPKWKSLKKERKELSDHIYRSDPWNEIGSPRFQKFAGKRDQQKAELFRKHLLFLYWKLTWKNM